jgi:hypothetical protein
MQGEEGGVEEECTGEGEGLGMLASSSTAA